MQNVLEAIAKNLTARREAWTDEISLARVDVQGVCTAARQRAENVSRGDHHHLRRVHRNSASARKIRVTETHEYVVWTPAMINDIGKRADEES